MKIVSLQLHFALSLHAFQFALAMSSRGSQKEFSASGGRGLNTIGCSYGAWHRPSSRSSERVSRGCSHMRKITVNEAVVKSAHAELVLDNAGTI